MVHRPVGRRVIGRARTSVWLLLALLGLSCDAASSRPPSAGAEHLGHLTLDRSGYLGGALYDAIRDVTTDDHGNVYLTGGTESPDFPTTDGAYDRSHNGNADAFVMKLGPDGQVLWSTFLGGPSHDRAYAVAVDRSGYVYVAGRAGADFPVTPGALQTTFRGGKASGPYGSQNGFVAKLTPDGRAVIFATHFGAGDDSSHPIRDLAVDDDGHVYVATSSATGDFPPAILEGLRRGFQPARAGGSDGVVAKIASDGTRVIWATYLGGSGNEAGEPSIRLDAARHVYFMTGTTSTDAPTTPNAYGRELRGRQDFYLVKLKPDGSGLVYGTYVGGSHNEGVETHHLALDRHGNAYIAGGTTSADFPTTAGAFQRTYGGAGGRGTGARSNHEGDVAVAKISSDGSTLLAATFIGGRHGDAAEGIAVDADGNVYLAGGTFSDNFPVTVPAATPAKQGVLKAIAVKLSPDFTRLLYATTMGGSGLSATRAAALDARGRFYLAGETISREWPVRNALMPSYRGGNGDGIVARFSPTQSVTRLPRR